MITKESWGRTAAGKEVLLYTLTNANGMKVQVTSFGARLVSVWAPDRKGELGNVIVGRTLSAAAAAAAPPSAATATASAAAASSWMGRPMS